jgi:predicted permease
VAFGLVPALQSTSPDLTRALRGGAPIRARQRKTGRLRSLLVGVQVAGSALLLVIAGLFLRGLSRAERLDPGYITHRVLWVSLNLEDLGYSSQRVSALHAQLRDRLSGLPGVRGVALARAVPLVMHRTTAVTLPTAQSSTDGSVTQVGANIVSREYFGVLGISLVRGRLFTEAEARAGSGETPVVVSESMASLMQASGAEPLGARFADGTRRLVVTGIAKDVQNGSLARMDGPFIYQAASPDSLVASRLVVRHEGPSAEIASALKEAARRFDPAVIVRAEPFEAKIDRVLRPVRVTALLATVLGVLATLLALVGVYGTVSFTAAQRTREIGVRVALGARPRDVIRLVTGQGMRVVMIGLAVGSLCAAAASRLMRAVLFGLSPFDPIAFLAIAALVLGASMLAVWRPARRAARSAPRVAQRTDSSGARASWWRTRLGSPFFARSRTR